MILSTLSLPYGYEKQYKAAWMQLKCLFMSLGNYFDTHIKDNVISSYPYLHYCIFPSNFPLLSVMHTYKLQYHGNESSSFTYWGTIFFKIHICKGQRGSDVKKFLMWSVWHRDQSFINIISECWDGGGVKEDSKRFFNISIDLTKLGLGKSARWPHPKWPPAHRLLTISISRCISIPFPFSYFLLGTFLILNPGSLSS